MILVLHNHFNFGMELNYILDFLFPFYFLFYLEGVGVEGMIYSGGWCNCTRSGLFPVTLSNLVVSRHPASQQFFWFILNFRF